jgi:hypothetical protein
MQQAIFAAPKNTAARVETPDSPPVFRPAAPGSRLRHGIATRGAVAGRPPRPHIVGKQHGSRGVTERPTDDPVQPRSEPEIIPPGHDSDRHSSRDRRHRGPRVAFDARAFERVYVARPRPLAALVAALGLGAVALVLVVCLLGVVLVALPAIVTVAAIALITAYFRGTRRQLP